MRNVLLYALTLLLSHSIYAQCTISSEGSNVAGLAQASWGQSFVAPCSGEIQTITFNSASNVATGAILSVRDGLDCNSAVLHSQGLASITNGENVVSLNASVSVIEGNTYYFSVHSNLGTGWQIRYSQTSQVPGNLKTYPLGAAPSSCGWNFPNYDWKFSVSFANAIPGNAENIDLFIWAGQSNALGWRGDAAQYPADPYGLDPQIRFNYEFINTTSSNGWITMQPQQGLYPSGHFGAEVSFSRRLKQAGYNPAIFKFSKGATSLYANWKTPGNGGYYDVMITKLTAAIAELENLGHTVTIRGFVWIQGESDAESITYANAYYSNLLSIINHMRNNVASDGFLPVALGVDEQHPAIINQPLVLNAHQIIAGNDDLITFTSMIGLPKADFTHLTPAGLVAHGERIFNDMDDLLTGPAPEEVVNCTISSFGNSVSGVSKSSWGQSFIAPCTSEIEVVTFNAASNVAASATLTLMDGMDCNAVVLHTQGLASIVNGDNVVTLSDPVVVTEGSTYYFSVQTNNLAGWQIRYSSSNQVPGNLRTYSNGASPSSCGWNFSNYDWNFSVSLTDEPQVVTEDIDLFIWAGESNAQGGMGDASQYPADPDELDGQIRLNYQFINATSSNGWISLQPQEGLFPNGHFGPEVSFSRSLKVAGYNPAIYKFTKGTTSLYANWKTPGNGGYYDDMVAELNASIAELENLGHTVTIRGIVWIQGESDAVNATYASTYSTSLLSVINDLRSNVANDGSLPVILGVDEQHPAIVNQPAILNAHQTIAANDEFTLFTSMIGLPKADITNLTPAGLVMHGEIIFDAMHSLLSNSGVDPQEYCTLTSDGSKISGLFQRSWGQSFIPDCSGDLNSIMFNSATNVATGATLTLRDGMDCNAAVMHTHGLASITNGDNVVALNSPVAVTEGNTYYFSVQTNNATGWQIRYSSANQVPGNLRTYSNGASPSTCGWNFSGYDWDFSVTIGVEPDQKSSIADAGESIDAMINNGVLVYPNPTKYTATIKGNSYELETVRVYDKFGIDVSSQVRIVKINPEEINIDLSRLNSGMFFIKTNSATGKVFKL